MSDIDRKCAWCGGAHRQMYGESGASPQACINTLLGERDDIRAALARLRAENQGLTETYQRDQETIFRQGQELARKDAALRQIADGTIPWRDGKRRMGSRSPRDYEAFALSTLKGAKE